MRVSTWKFPASGAFILQLCLLQTGCAGSDQQTMQGILSDRQDSPDISSVRLHTLRNAEIVVDDAASVEYLSVAFRKAKCLGFSTEFKLPRMRADVRFSNGAESRISMTLHDPDTLIIRYPEDSLDDGAHYWVPLIQPIPKRLALALRTVD